MTLTYAYDLNDKKVGVVISGKEFKKIDAELKDYHDYLAIKAKTKKRSATRSVATRKKRKKK